MTTEIDEDFELDNLGATPSADTYTSPIPPKRDYSVNPFRLSESTLSTFLTCERRFELDRLIENLEKDNKARESTAETVRGQAYGAGVQSYMLHGDMDRALYDCWLAYWPQLENFPKTFQARVLNNLLMSQETMNRLRAEYRVATFNGKPAVELSFRLNLDERWYFVGYIDIVLQHKSSGIFGPLEIKTTWLNRTDLRPAYQNSGQNIGYSIVVDQIAGAAQSTFNTPYLVCQESQHSIVPKIHVFPFPRTLQDRLRWFVTLGHDLQRLNQLTEMRLFPQRQKGCMSYGRTCPYFGSCHVTGDKYKAPREDANEYQFTYNLDEVIADHVRRIQGT